MGYLKRPRNWKKSLPTFWKMRRVLSLQPLAAGGPLHYLLYRNSKHASQTENTTAEVFYGDNYWWTIIDRQLSRQKIRQKLSVIKTNTSDDIKKIVHFGILIHILSWRQKETQVFVMITENFWQIFWRTFWRHYLTPYKTPAKACLVWLNFL